MDAASAKAWSVYAVRVCQKLNITKGEYHVQRQRGRHLKYLEGVGLGWGQRGDGSGRFGGGKAGEREDVVGIPPRRGLCQSMLFSERQRM